MINTVQQIMVTLFVKTKEFSSLFCVTLDASSWALWLRSKATVDRPSTEIYG